MIRLTRRVAAHEVYVGEKVYSPGVVEIEDGRVVNAYQLKGEQASTEWLGGIITVKADAHDNAKAYYNGKPIN